MFRHGPSAKELQPFRIIFEIVDPPVFPMCINPAESTEVFLGGSVGCSCRRSGWDSATGAYFPLMARGRRFQVWAEDCCSSRYALPVSSWKRSISIPARVVSITLAAMLNPRISTKADPLRTHTICRPWFPRVDIGAFLPVIIRFHCVSWWSIIG